MDYNSGVVAYYTKGLKWFQPRRNDNIRLTEGKVDNTPVARSIYRDSDISARSRRAALTAAWSYTPWTPSEHARPIWAADLTWAGLAQIASEQVRRHVARRPIGGRKQHPSSPHAYSSFFMAISKCPDRSIVPALVWREHKRVAELSDDMMPLLEAAGQAQPARRERCLKAAQQPRLAR